MKILLDECLPLDFRHSFPTHEAHTVQWAGLKGMKNGELLQAAAIAGYEVLLTVDQGIPRQQSSTNQMEDLLPVAPAIRKSLESIQPGQTVVVPF